MSGWICSLAQNDPPVTIVRGANKLWYVEYVEQNVTKTRGLFPSEVKLAHMLQEQIIQCYNQSESGNG